MPRSEQLFGLLALGGSALCWWPVVIEPGLDWFPVWLPFALIACAAGCLTLLSTRSWWVFPLLSTIGTALGLLSGFRFWPVRDGVAAGYAGFYVLAGIALTALVSLLTCYPVYRMRTRGTFRRRPLWLALAVCLAWGPLLAAATPPLVARRVAHNDMAAARRFTALKRAVEATRRNQEDICDAGAIRRNYAGPSFSQTDWRYIPGNYVHKDGHFFMLYCREAHGGYTIDVMSDAEPGYGVQSFCADESGQAGCTMEWDRTRHSCRPCQAGR